MSLSLIFDDDSAPELIEPGFYRNLSTREIATVGNPSDEDSSKSLWRDDATGTLMLKPLQFDPTYLNTEQQLADGSVIRLDDMQVYAGNLSSAGIFEAPVGNNANPYIWHIPAGPSDFFPAAVNPFPGSAPALVSVEVPYDLLPSVIALPSQHLETVYEVPATMPVAHAEPAPVVIGDTADGKWLFHTKDRLEANQALLFRWHHPDARAGYPVTYIICVGQYCLKVKDVLVEVFRDTSANGDRSAWKLVQKCPLWSLRDLNHAVGDTMPAWSMSDSAAHDRHLLWFPYRRNQVLLQANTRQWALLTTRATPRRLDDDSDWDITRSDTVAVWVMTPAPGRIQIQKIAYPTLNIHVDAPTTRLDYTPGVAPTFTVNADADHSTVLTAVRSQPPSYTLPENDANSCPAPVTVSGDQSQTYGGVLRFQSVDGRHTPYLYGLEIEARRTFAARATSPFTIGDTSAALYHLDKATISLGLRPGEGRLTTMLTDWYPFNLATYYYRSTMPIALKSGSTVVFQGWTEPNEVIPLKEGSDTPRSLTISGLDRWKQLMRHNLRDQRDWSIPGPGGVEYGHIEVVKFILQQGGVDTTNFVTPPYTTGVAGLYNTPLSLGLTDGLQAKTKETKGGWKAEKLQNAADYIQKIAKCFSGWDVGFYSTGVPFYLPRDYYTTPTATFTAAHTGSAPYFYHAQWKTIEPEANVVYAEGAAENGGRLGSAEWVDWASVLNKNAVNYLGYRKREVVWLPGTFLCWQLNWIARRVWDRARRRRYTIEFEADFVVGLEVGHVCTVGSYGNYRVTSINVTFVHGDVTKARYAADLVETGYGT